MIDGIIMIREYNRDIFTNVKIELNTIDKLVKFILNISKKYKISFDDLCVKIKIS